VRDGAFTISLDAIVVVSAKSAWTSLFISTSAAEALCLRVVRPSVRAVRRRSSPGLPSTASLTAIDSCLRRVRIAGSNVM